MGCRRGKYENDFVWTSSASLLDLDLVRTHLIVFFAGLILLIDLNGVQETCSTLPSKIKDIYSEIIQSFQNRPLPVMELIQSVQLADGENCWPVVSLKMGVRGESEDFWCSIAESREQRVAPLV